MAITSTGRNQANKPDDPDHQEMLEWVQDIAKSSDYTYGSRRMKKALNVLGYPVSRDKARKLMREACAGAPTQEIQGDDKQQSQAAGV